MMLFVGGEANQLRPLVFFDQRSGICEGREFIDCPARYKCPMENMLLKFRLKLNIVVELEPLLMPAHS